MSKNLSPHAENSVKTARRGNPDKLIPHRSSKGRRKVAFHRIVRNELDMQNRCPCLTYIADLYFTAPNETDWS